MVEAAPTLARLRGETEEMLAHTARLAAVDSGSDDPGGVARVCELTAELLAARGFHTESGPAGGLCATLPVGAGPRLLVVGHADTVWPAGTAADWPVRRAGGMLSGPGVGDMKACLVMAAHALAAARDAGLDGIGEITLLVVGDEELGSVSSRAWIEAHAAGARACLGLEAAWPGGGVVVARGAVGALQLQACGRSAHCAGHEGRGASAVAALAPLVGALEALSRPAEEVLVSVGTFRGGVARQVVPDRAELSIDRRAPSAETASALLDGVRAVVDGAKAEADADAGVSLQLSGDITRPAFPAAASRELYAVAARRAAQLGLPLTAVRSRGGSDASFAAARGVATLDGLGPICHDSCARGERIEIDSLAGRAALMALVACDLAAAWSAEGQARDSGNVDAPA
jgi:glutamate carboxypeptidase